MKKKLKGLLLAVATVAFASALVVPAMALADEAVGSSFTDVEGDEWFAADVEWANESGLMTGTGDGTNFEPNLGNTRAMLVTSLHRLEGKPAATGADARVPEGAWYTEAALWALEAGVLKGYGSGEDLGLADPLTREQLATFVWRYIQLEGIDVSEGADTNILSFIDASEISNYAMEAMQWCCAAGVITGYTDAEGVQTGYLGPRDAATRGMSAAGNLLVVPEDRSVELDLNGKTLEVTAIVNKGTLTVSNGTIEGCDSSRSAIESTGNLTINANVIGARHALRIEGGTAIIDGGSYSVRGSAGMTTHALNAGDGDKEVSVIIRGGTFTGPKGTSSDSGYAVQAQGSAQVVILAASSRRAPPAS